MPEEYDFNKLQADAVRRAREMQSRARISPVPPQSHHREAPPPPAAAAPTENLPRPEPEKRIDVPNEHGGIMQALFQDRERTIILALLLLLSGEDGNHELMFALMFLLM